MNPQSLRTRKPSCIKSYKQLLLNKVCFPSQNLVIPQLNCIKPQELQRKQSKLYPSKVKLSKFEKYCEPSYFLTKLIKICNFENSSNPNELQNKVQQQQLNRQVYRSMDSDNLVRIKSNQVRVRQLSKDFLTDRNTRSNISPIKKKVRFYEKVEYWVQNKEKNFEYDYRYFEALKLL